MKKIFFCYCLLLLFSKSSHLFTKSFHFFTAFLFLQAFRFVSLRPETRCLL